MNVPKPKKSKLLVTGKTAFFVRGSFYPPHSFCLKIDF